MSFGGLRYSPVGLVSLCLVVAGLILGAAVNMAWLLLMVAGVFAPNILREFGILKDRDEFQQEAARRAGYRAYLVGGVFTATILVSKAWGTRNLDENEFATSLILTVFVLTYLLSYLTSFWGPQKAAFRVLVIFGFFWLMFVVLGHRGIELVMELAVALPFFVLAFLSRRWPKVTGVILVGLAIFAFFFFNLGRLFQSDTSAAHVLLVLLLPLLFSGVALIGSGKEIS